MQIRRKKTKQAQPKGVLRRDSLIVRMQLQFFAMVAVVLVCITVILGIQLSDMVFKSTEKEISALAEENANQVLEYLNTMQTQAASLANACGQMEGIELALEERQGMIQALMQGAMKDSRIFGVYTAWEPDLAFENTPLGLSYYMYRWKNNIQTDTLYDYEVYKEGEYYAAAKSSMAPHMTEPYPYQLTNGETTWLVTISNPILSSTGSFLGVANCDIMVDTISNLDYNMGGYKKAYTYLLSKGGAYLNHTWDKALVGSAAQEERGIRKAGQKLGQQQDGALGEEAYVIHMPVKVTGLNDALTSTFVVSSTEVRGPMVGILLTVILISIVGLISITVGVYLILRRALRPIKDILELAENLERGDLHTQISINSKDELGQLAKVFQNTTNVWQRYILEISQSLSLLAQGDLCITIENVYSGDFAPIKEALLSISSSLNHTLSLIHVSAQQVNLGAEQVSDGAQALAAGAAEQAATVEELSSAISQVAEQAQKNMENVQTAAGFTKRVKEGVTLGNEHMKILLKAMKNIDTTSSQIVNIAKAIEEIAFQTNILSLNAAIEAARAGAVGKGFAVVADEVRNLAAKSAEAAKQTAQLIEHSVSAVADGSQITQQTAQILQEVQIETEFVNNSIAEIELASSEQTHGIEQIQQGLSQVSAVVQTNAASAEENSATSEEMSAQAETLRQEIGKFKLNPEDVKADGRGTTPFKAEEIPKEAIEVYECATLPTTPMKFEAGKY